MIVVDENVSEDGLSKQLLELQSDVYTPDNNTVIMHDVQASGQVLTYPQLNNCSYRKEDYEKKIKAVLNWRSSHKSWNGSITKASALSDKSKHTIKTCKHVQTQREQRKTTRERERCREPMQNTTKDKHDTNTTDTEHKPGETKPRRRKPTDESPQTKPHKRTQTQTHTPTGNTKHKTQTQTQTHKTRHKQTQNPHKQN